MAMTELARPRNEPKGRTKPRLAPPTPARSKWKELHDEAIRIGITFMPWQDIVARYVDAVAPDDRWLYPEAAAIVARQDGKTEFLVPHITRRLLMHRRIMHTAQNRELPREVFGRVVDVFQEHYPKLLARRPRFANGQEELRIVGGGHYRIVAPTRGGARGPSNDDLIIDEVRELTDHSFIAAAEPTLSASPNPQVLYLSNAGDEGSVVLNALRARAETDPSLAYLEWSAAPERSVDDRAGWLEANPAVGFLPGKMEYLERKFQSYRLAGTLEIFETEHLCRWVTTMRSRLITAEPWAACEAESLPEPRRPFMAVSVDPSGTRASAAIAWPLEDGSIALRLLYDVTGDPIDIAKLGKDMKADATKLGVRKVGFDPLTDVELARYFRVTEPLAGQKFANASSTFATSVEGKRIRWQDVDAVTDDLAWTARKDHDESGSFQAVRADDNRPITAALAAIRAVYLASEPTPTGKARVY